MVLLVEYGSLICYKYLLSFGSDTIKQFLLKTLILFYIVTSFTSATHIHIGEEEHIDDCQICVITTSFNSAQPPKYELSFSCEICSYLIDTAVDSINIEINDLKGFFSHAPPFLSLFQ